MKKLAIVSVYDKTGLTPFVQALSSLGVGILSTGGTAKYLTEQGIQLQSIDAYTGHPEILDGRVKTLHPKIHGGILARRNRKDDLAQLTENQISLIDFVVVNLYPFGDKIRELEAKGSISADAHGHDSMVEFIDIGGPTMIRAAAKNYRDVAAICDPADYETVINELREKNEVSLETRQRLAAKVFKTMAAYDGSIARFFSLSEKILDDAGNKIQLAPVEPIVLERKLELRYGENPHQSAGLYRRVEVGANRAPEPWSVLQGKELSYNNLLDLHGALDLFLELYQARGSKHPAVIIKHSNPCGAAMGATPLAAFESARDCDPVSAFGGIVVLSGIVDAELAQSVTSGFVEVVAAEGYSPEALQVFAKKKNIRVMQCSFDAYLAERGKGGLTMRNYMGDYLLQTIDNHTVQPTADQTVTEAKPSQAMMSDIDFAWRVCKHVKSNAIVLVKDGRAIGVGAGQMSRVDAAKVAVERAQLHGHDLNGAVGASDAFLPFADTLEIIQAAGVQALVQPGGSIKDEDVVKRANELGAVMLFTGERHFRH
ncbi:MAG: bifunctional phosphoribosylaminoimidazolecarboxamide formyltransferase/IMP cyclohydrolase [Bdellovibrionota bacterium]